MIIITINAGLKSYIEKIPDGQTRIKIDPEYYKDIDFIFDSSDSLKKYSGHFIYSYLV